MAYFDYAASAPMFPQSVDILSKSAAEDYANIAAVHKLARSLKDQVEQIRNELSSKILGNCSSMYQLVFTSSATESNNMVIMGLSKESDQKCLYNSTDHSSLVAPIKVRFGELIIKLPLLPFGEIDCETSKTSEPDQNVRLIVTSLVNGQNGIITPLEKLVPIWRRLYPNAHIHIDATQAIGKIACDFSSANIDSISFSSHKLGGPKGIGSLLIKKNIQLSPLLFGGGQEFGYRASSVATPLIKSFHYAVIKAISELDIFRNRMLEFNSQIRTALSTQLPEVVFVSPQDKTIHNIVSFALPGIFSDVVVRTLEQYNIFISTSSACSSKNKTNELFEEMQIPEEYHKNLIRLSFGHATTDEDIDFLLNKFIESVKFLKMIKGKK